MISKDANFELFHF